MKVILFFLILFFLFLSGVPFICNGISKENNAISSDDELKKDILTVEQVVSNLEKTLKKKFNNLDELTDGEQLTLVAIKDKKILELWKKINNKQKLIKKYKFTAYSGGLGPKLREGDLQIPEGIYKLTFLHPNSEYHLSIKLNYPNEFEKEKAKLDKRKKLGGEIFIHGKAITVGCIPIGDSAIEEVFYLVAKNGLENCKVIISPYDMRKWTIELDVIPISWENELYNIIKKELLNFNKNG